MKKKKLKRSRLRQFTERRKIAFPHYSNINRFTLNSRSKPIKRRPLWRFYDYRPIRPSRPQKCLAPKEPWDKKKHFAFASLFTISFCCFECTLLKIRDDDKIKKLVKYNAGKQFSWFNPGLIHFVSGEKNFSPALSLSEKTITPDVWNSRSTRDESFISVLWG